MTFVLRDISDNTNKKTLILLIKVNANFIFYLGSVRFTKNVCAKKSAEPLQSVDDNLPTHNLPKKCCF